MELALCGLCQSHRHRTLFRQTEEGPHAGLHEFTVVQCEECGLLYVNPRPKPEDIGRYYPSEYYEPASPRRFSRVKTWIMEDFYGYPTVTDPGVWRLLRKLLLWPEHLRRSLSGRRVLPWVGQGRLLDVGCGAGGNAAILKQQGWKVQALDMSERAVFNARRLLGDDSVQHGDLRSVRYPARSFDVVLMNHSLEHMYDPAIVLAEVRRILDDRGVLVVVVPNADSLEARLFGRSWRQWDLPRHLYHFGRTTLVKLLARTGFRVTTLRTGVGTLFFMASLEKVWKETFGCALPVPRFIEKVIAEPACLLAGHAGYGTEIIVYAVKE